MEDKHILIIDDDYHLRNIATRRAARGYSALASPLRLLDEPIPGRLPHQGERECARRRAQIAKGMIKVTG